MQDKIINVIRVAIQRPLYNLLDYSCDLPGELQPGCRVRVSLGNSVVVALVVETGVKSEFSELKPVIEIIDQQPLLDNSLLALLRWASSYYFYPLGEVLFHALPVNLRKGKQPSKIQFWQVSQKEQSIDWDSLNRAPKQQAILRYLIEHGKSDAQQLQSVFGDAWRNSLRELGKKELVETHEIDEELFPIDQKQLIAKKPLSLTQEQQNCVGKIGEYFKQAIPKPVLLHGITGSGKTEVYLRSISEIVEQGKQILVLVPEIGLTPQLVVRFQQHFPQCNIASLHSALSDVDRLRVWSGAKSGNIQIVIGTRSAVFTPMKNLGAILIDEEHDASFKQQEGFLYQGRDMAIKRAYEANVPVLLGSATPSLESLFNVKKQRYHYLQLRSRPGESNPPEIVLQDIRTLPLEAGISGMMMEEIRQHLDSNNQVMLFLNRRGFAPVLMCPDCGWHANCQKCDRGMIYHAGASKVLCHHCGFEERVTANCPECNSNRLTTLGYGTERIEEVLNSYFPDTPVIRIDRDSTSRKGALEEKLELVHQGEPVIIIGTQMLTKGHDFPKLTLVGILDVDQALFSMDYRAQERLSQQVIQVAGRAGRGKEKGRVILQTSQPQHPLLLKLLSQGYSQTAEQILNERELWNYPPVGSQSLVRVSAMNADNALSFITNLSSRLVQFNNNEVSLLGPMPSPLAKRANRFRYQLLISANQRGQLHNFLDSTLSTITKLRKTGGVRWVIDVDPVDFL